MPAHRRKAEAHVSADAAPTQELIAPEGNRWSNAGTPANAFEQRVTDPIESGKEVVRMAGQNAASPANAFEQRIQQAI